MMAGNGRSSRGSAGELKLRAWLEGQGISHATQWPFDYSDGAVMRHGFADFYLPGPRLVVECDGYWHWNADAKRRDAARDTALMARGVSVLRIDAKEIKRNFPDVASKIRAFCCIAWVHPARLIHRDIRHQPVYNLEVADDHSYVAGGFVVHNCEPMDGQEVKLGEPFLTGDGREIMRPTAHPQCRCAVGLIFK